MLIDVQNVTKSFGGLTAIDNLSFTISENKITSLIGPNGAGKSTVFNLVTSYLSPDNGKIFYHDKEITNASPSKIANMGVVRTFQDVKIFNKLSVKENVLLGLRYTHEQKILPSIFVGLPKEKKYEMEHKVLELMEFVGIENIWNERAENISYAEKKLVILARALATEAELIMLDEPAAGLSEDSIETMVNLIHHVIDNGQTIFMVEHNMDLVLRISDHVIVLNFGEKIAEGSPEYIRRNNKVIEVYLGIS
jgi:branched-chain amino acid transport system ATP-binding protein